MFIILAARGIKQWNQFAQQRFQLFWFENRRRHQQGGWLRWDQRRIALDEPFNILLVFAGFHSRLAFFLAYTPGPNPVRRLFERTLP